MKDAIPKKTPFDTLTPRQQLALVSSPALPDGVGGFYLDIYEDESIELSADITDHYTEKNAAIHDHMAIRPEKFIVHGVVGEIALLKSKAKVTNIPKRNPLPLSEDLSPEITEGAMQAAAIAAVDAYASQDPMAQLEASAANGDSTPIDNYSSATVPAPSPFSVYRRSVGIVEDNLQGQAGYLRAEPTKRRQKDAYGYLYALWKGRQFVTVETPWGVFDTMLIESLRVEQRAESKSISDFYVTFKAIRFAGEVVVQVVADSRAQEQNAPEVPVGQAGQTPVQLQTRDGTPVGTTDTQPADTVNVSELRSP